MNDAVGALSYTDSTADTLSRIDSCDTVINGDSVLRTNHRAVAVAKTSVVAEFITAVRHVGGAAGLVTLVVVFF